MLRILDIASKCILCGALALVVLTAPKSAQATSFKVVYSFTGGSKGGNPGTLIIDANGNLYGAEGQPVGYGSVFKLAPKGAINFYYLEKGGEGTKGLVMDAKGTLWVNVTGGGGIGCGVIFTIRPSGREVLKHDFAGPPSDGCAPIGALIMDESGDFYGTTFNGGKNREGTVFELAAGGTETVLYSFCRKANCADGASPDAGLVVDSEGNLYGATYWGGRQGCGDQCGTVFELAPDGTETVLHKFRGPPNDGNGPNGTLIIDESGNFYGTLFTGGRAGCFEDTGCGAAFKLAPDGTYGVLHFFTGKTGDGANPVAGLIADSADNLYGTTEYGGGRGCTISPYGCGTIFELAPDGTETILHSFGNGSNGANPTAGLVADGKGNFYGTASEGGAYGFGSVFEITP